MSLNEGWTQTWAIYRGLLVYLDDILIATRGYEERSTGFESTITPPLNELSVPVLLRKSTGWDLNYATKVQNQ